MIKIENIPNGKDMLERAIELLSFQQGVTRKYKIARVDEIITQKKEENPKTNKNSNKEK